MTYLSRSLGVAAMTALTLGAAWPAAAAPGAKAAHHMCHGKSRLSVTGEGEARVAPDQATVQLGVTTQAESAAEAMRQNSTQQNGVIEALTGAGIEAADIQTSGLNLTPMVDYGEGRAPRVTGYQASNMVSVRVRDVARLGEVLDAIVTAGANEINGIAFTREDSEATEDDARRAAVADARHKAEVLAEAAGLTLGRLVSLRDGQPPQGPRPMMMEARMASDTAVPIAAGELSVTAQVQVEYALIDEAAECGPRGHRGPDGAPDAPVPGDLPPPLGTDTGAPDADEPVVPMGESPSN